MTEILTRIFFAYWPGSKDRIIILNDDLPLIGKVYHFHDDYRMRQVLASKGPLYGIVKGYTIAIFYGGVLGTSQARPDAAQINWALNEMAGFYLENKIKKDPAVFAKYLNKGWWPFIS